MRALWIALALLAVLFVGEVQAAEKKPLDPPKMEEMVKLETFENPVKLPEVLLSSTDKGLVYLSEHKNKFLLINLWATWCPPCVKELPSLNALQLAMKSDKFEVITISLDQGEEGMRAAKKFLEDNKLSELTPYIDANNEMQRLEVMKGVAGIPVTILVDGNSKVVARYQGDADWNGRAAHAVIDYYLANTSYNPYADIIRQD